jgi:hypothetical protein
MLIIGCDFHTRYQQIAMLDETTGRVAETRGGSRVPGGPHVGFTCGAFVWSVQAVGRGPSPVNS